MLYPRLLLTAAVLAGLAAACRPEPASDEPDDTMTGALVCELLPDDTLTILHRPSPTSDVFGQAAPGNTLRPTATAAGGWIGFDPAVAQAANVGPFRLRWIAPDGPFTLSGGCLALPVVEAPTDGCYAMAGAAISVHAAPAVESPVIDTLEAGGFAAVVGRQENWARVRLRDGREAWIAPDDGNFNGPCDSEGAGGR